MAVTRVLVLSRSAFDNLSALYPMAVRSMMAEVLQMTEDVSPRAARKE